jgi:serine/threonine-protein kinase RsbW
MNKAFPASLDKLYEMLNFVRTNAITAGFEESQAHKIELAAEEALVNIIHYGYPEDSGKIEIDCSITTEGQLQIIIKDHGIAYNPLANGMSHNQNVPAESRKIGGYGIFFIVKIMDEVTYVREGDFNILTLIKKKENFT